MQSDNPEDKDLAVLEEEVRDQLAAGHKYLQHRDDAGAASAFQQASEFALRALCVRFASDEPPDASADDRTAWDLLNRSSTQYHHKHNQLGDWYREGARRFALQRYEPHPS
jgi:hypothetical protein